MEQHRSDAGAWIEYLEDEDLAFIRRFVLASGSLKELAQLSSISYPTIRLRLDRMIEKIKLFEAGDIDSEFERVLRLEHAEGRIDVQAMRSIRKAHEKELKRSGGSK